MDVLGAKAYSVSATVKGEFSTMTCEKLTNEIIERIGMTPAYKPQLFLYPYNDKGGVGYTYFQPITESFIVWDVWPLLGGAYLNICSCREFDKKIIFEIVEENGLEIMQINQEQMNLQ